MFRPSKRLGTSSYCLFVRQNSHIDRLVLTFVRWTVRGIDRHHHQSLPAILGLGMLIERKFKNVVAVLAAGAFNGTEPFFWPFRSDSTVFINP
jgi:hypothetical protein